MDDSYLRWKRDQGQSRHGTCLLRRGSCCASGTNRNLFAATSAVQHSVRRVSHVEGSNGCELWCSRLAKPLSFVGGQGLGSKF
jgi:hypothetical protein